MRSRKHEHKKRVCDRSRNRPGVASNTICNQLAYQDRHGAKTAARALPIVAGQRARAYDCDACGLWHADYLPALVVQGVVTAGEWYGTDGSEPLGPVLTDLVEQMEDASGGSATFERRVDATDTDLWGAIIDVRGTLFVARDYDSPSEAAAAVLAEHDAALLEAAAA